MARDRDHHPRAVLMRLDTVVSWSARGGALVLCSLAVWGALKARAWVQAEPRFDLSQWRFELGPLPAWAPPELEEEIGLWIGGLFGDPLTVFTPQVLGKVRLKLLDCPWVREVRRIRLSYPGLRGSRGEPSSRRGLWPGPGGGRGGAAAGSIELELELRVPIALVSAGGAFYLTDGEGVRLGQALDRERARERGLPAIVGGETRRPRIPPPAGMAFQDRDVREGLEVARVLFEAGIEEEFPHPPDRALIHEIDVSNVGARRGECEIVLTAAGSMRLGWGRSPISAGARTLPVPAILENLRKVLRRAPECSSTELALLYTSPIVIGSFPSSSPISSSGGGTGGAPR